MNFKHYIYLTGFLILVACKPPEPSSAPIESSSSSEIKNYLKQQLQKDKQQITQSLNTYIQCRYDYSPRKSEMCSHILVIPEEVKMIGSWLGVAMEKNYSQEELAVDYFKLSSLIPAALLPSETKLDLPSQILDNGIEKVCSRLGKYEITVTEDRRKAMVNCADQKIFHLEYWDNYWKVVLNTN